MTQQEIVVDGRALLHAVKIGVRMPRMFGLRMWLATRLFEMAAAVTGFNVTIEVDDD